MKRIMFYIVLLVLSIACSNDDDNLKSAALEIYPLRLGLESSVPGYAPYAYLPKATGDELPWQEYYLLFDDGTFLRNRVKNGNTVEERGTFKNGKMEDGTSYIEFSYAKENALRGSCSSGNEEYLYLQDDGLYKNEWGACDGLFLEYKVIVNR